MSIDITTGVLGLVGGAISSLLFWVAVISSRFARLETDVEIVKSFYEKLIGRMVDLNIKQETPELDRLLLAFKRGEELTPEEWKELTNQLEHHHIEAIRNERFLDDPTRKVSTAFLLAAVEARRPRPRRVGLLARILSYFWVI